MSSTVRFSFALLFLSAGCGSFDETDPRPQPRPEPDPHTAPTPDSDPDSADIGVEKALPRHLRDGDEQRLSIADLLAHGQKVFSANWTIQEGQGRPLTRGTGAPLAHPAGPLLFPRNFNRVSAPDANSCAGCHNLPFGIPGGGGDIVTNVFVLGQRFDNATFAADDLLPLRGSVDESGERTVLETVGNLRATLGMFGSGYIEMLARQMTRDLQAIRERIPPGALARLLSKGVDFGTLRRQPDGVWDTSAVKGLVAPSLASAGPEAPPSLLIRPFHQASNVVSLRQFTNNAFNHHHGIQSVERFGDGTDPDGDGVSDELSRADVTAATLFQATMAVPGRVIPRRPKIEQAVLLGERLFQAIGCNECHRSSLPLDQDGWIFTEPGPFNPPGNLEPEAGPAVVVDLSGPDLPTPRLAARDGVVQVPAFTDLRVHDITSGPDDPNREPLDMNAPPGSPAFKAGNGRFLTRKLWGVANEAPYFHHGKYTTMREAILAHAGEATAAAAAYRALSDQRRAAVIEFLKTLQVLPPGTRHQVVDEHHQPRSWPPGPEGSTK